ncbi:hypothetical protein JYK00_01675 [Thermosipho ferrireducens]|uniref:ABC-2 type transport system permease protein n=1 Tax=Thermosipho ferrireducens TaxID=2571116 RepID=A0ABX7S8P8_9BACT|nr:hypothetical protein [Thermosipho ferrireducens]QTA38273.1 hypothetical protein JYK00_01675 [Thermosipho ferrireducens]
MREFLILLRYGIFVENNMYGGGKVKKARKIKRAKFKSNLFWSFLGAMSFGVIVFFFMKNTFNQMVSVNPALPEIMISFWMTLLSLFFIVGFVGIAMYSFARNDEIELLLTLPIRRRILTAYQLFVSTISQALVLSIYIFIYLAYAVVVKEAILLAFLKLIVHVAFLISISSVIAILLGGKASKGLSRKISLLVSLSMIFIYFIIVGAQDVDISKYENIIKFIQFSQSSYNVFAWSFLGGVKILYSALLSIVFGFLFFVMAEKMSFEPVQRRSAKKKHAIKGSGSSILAIYKKDFKAVLRYEQFLFFILYPAGFGVFMGLMNQNPFVMLFTVIPITTFYVAMESGILASREFLCMDTARTFPVHFKNMMFPKIIIPALINFLIILVVFGFILFKVEFSYMYLLLIVVPFILFGMSAIIGSYFVAKNPPKIENIGKIFGVGATFAIEGITMGIAFGCIFPLIYIIESSKLSLMGLTIAWISFVGSVALAIWVSYYFYKKLKKCFY